MVLYRSLNSNPLTMEDLNNMCKNCKCSPVETKQNSLDAVAELKRLFIVRDALRQLVEAEYYSEVMKDHLAGLNIEIFNTAKGAS